MSMVEEQKVQVRLDIVKALIPHTSPADLNDPSRIVSRASILETYVLGSASTATRKARKGKKQDKAKQRPRQT